MDSNGLFYKAEIKKIPGSRIAGYCCTNDTLPTGALDSRASGKLLELFDKVNEGGQTILMVTHSLRAAAHAGRVLFIRDGEVFHQIYRGAGSTEEMYRKISDAMTVLNEGGENRA